MIPAIQTNPKITTPIASSAASFFFTSSSLFPLLAKANCNPHIVIVRTMPIIPIVFNNE